MRMIRWTVTCLSAPSISRYCKKCKQRAEFICSNCFRINAQAKALDIWLIYNCQYCKTSWNSTIYSRINSNKIDPNLLNLFYENSPSLVLKYSLDKSILKKNGVKLEKMNYKVTGETFPLDQAVTLHIACEYPLKLKLATIIKNELNLSNSELNHWAESAIVGYKEDFLKETLQKKNKILIRVPKETLATNHETY